MSQCPAALFVLSTALAAAIAGDAPERQPYRADHALMQRTFAEMIDFGFVGTQQEPMEPAAGGLGRRRSAMSYIMAREAAAEERYLDAVEYYRQSVLHDPGNMAAWEETGDLFFEMGRRRQAAQAWGRVIKAQDDEDLLYKCGLIEVSLSEYENAAEHMLRRRLFLHDALPVSVKTILQNAVLLVSLQSLGNLDLVREMRLEIDSLFLELALTSGSDVKSGETWMLLVKDLFALGDLEAARTAARVRLQEGTLDGQYAPWIAAHLKTRYVLLDALLQGSGAATADLIEDLEARSLLRGSPTEWRKDIPIEEALYQAGEDFGTLGNVKGANRLYARALVHDPEHILARNNLGYSALETGPITSTDIKIIEASWRDAEEQDARSLALVLDTIGWLRYMQSHYEDDEHARGAIGLLRDSIDRMEEPDPVVLDHLGDALWMAGHREEAGETWRKALQRLEDPGFKGQQLRNFDMVQGGYWHFNVIDSQDLYDREYGDLERGLNDKVSAVEHGKPPPVAPRRKFMH